MAKTQAILTRRKAVGNIRKITATMEMIATARFGRLRAQTEGLAPYTEAVNRLVGHLQTCIGAQADHPLLREQGAGDRDAVVVVTSNRGMCGGYNAGVLRLFEARCERLVAAGRRVEVYALGDKAIAYLRGRGIEPVFHRRQFEASVSTEEVAEISQALMDRFTAGELGAVDVVHVRYVSRSVQQPMVLRLLPLEPPAPPPRAASRAAVEYDFWPDAETILDALLPRTVGVLLYRALLDAVAAEQVARMTAMRLAAHNAQEMIDELTMEYNRLRQGAITAELAEIVGGAEVLR